MHSKHGEADLASPPQPKSESVIITPKSQTPIRLMSCNIQAGNTTRKFSEYISRGWSHLLPGGKRHTLKSLAQISTPFDVVGLQECDPGSLRSGFTNQTNFLAELGEFPYWSHQANRSIANIASSANAVLSRVEPTEVLDYPLPGRMGGRGVLLCQFGNGEQAWHLAVTHLALGLPSRIAQISFLSELLANKKRLVLMGDFNCAYDSPEMHQLFRQTSLQPPPEKLATYPSWQPSRSLDHIFYSGFRLNDYRVLPAGNSDHLAVAVELSPNDAAQ